MAPLWLHPDPCQHAARRLLLMSRWSTLQSLKQGCSEGPQTLHSAQSKDALPPCTSSLRFTAPVCASSGCWHVTCGWPWHRAAQAASCQHAAQESVALQDPAPPSAQYVLSRAAAAFAPHAAKRVGTPSHIAAACCNATQTYGPFAFQHSTLAPSQLHPQP